MSNWFSIYTQQMRLDIISSSSQILQTIYPSYQLGIQNCVIIFIFSLNSCIKHVSIWNCYSESKSNTTWNKMQKPVIQSTLFVGMLYISSCRLKEGLPTANCVQNVTVWFVFQPWCVCLALWYHSSSSYGIVTFNQLCLSSGTHGRLRIPKHKQRYLQKTLQTTARKKLTTVLLQMKRRNLCDFYFKMYHS